MPQPCDTPYEMGVRLGRIETKVTRLCMALGLDNEALGRANRVVVPSTAIDEVLDLLDADRVGEAYDALLLLRKIGELHAD